MSHKILDITTKQRSQQLIPASTIPREHPHPPSLFLNVWEFDHDPDDNFMIKAILERERKQYSGRLPNRNGLSKEKIRAIQRKSSHKMEECHPIRNSILKDGNYKYPKQSTLKPIIDPQLQLNSNTSNQIDSPHQQKKNTIEQYIQQRHHSIKTNAISKQIIEEVPRQQLLSNCNRDLQIYSHKLMSNFNLLGRQLKQLILWNQIEILQMDIEGYRRAVMKREIECRKLRISLRNEGSTGYLERGRVMKMNKNNKGSIQKCKNRNSEKHKKILDVVSPHKFQLPKKVSKKQLQLQHQLTKYKQLSIKLSIKQSQITNYYKILKSQLSSLSLSHSHLHSLSLSLFLSLNPNIQSFQQTNQSQHPSSNNQIPTQSKIIKNIPISNRKQQFILLMKKRQLLQISVEQAICHYQNKSSNLKEEIRLLGLEIQIVQGKIYGGKKGIRKGRGFSNGKLSLTKLIRNSGNTVDSVKSCSKKKRVSLQDAIVQKQIYTDRYPIVYQRHLLQTQQSQSENSQKHLKLSIQVHSFQ